MAIFGSVAIRIKATVCRRLCIIDLSLIFLFNYLCIVPIEALTPAILSPSQARLQDFQESSFDGSGNDESISQVTDNQSHEQNPGVGCASTPLGCFGTHRALHTLLPILICIAVGAGTRLSVFTAHRSL
jgi:hypothetical protein